LLIFRTELSIYAFAGIIMLIGLVKKNGIMMIDFALEAQRLEGKGPEDAIVEACAVRFRPIMMTTMAALMAGLPIALGFGAGAEARRPVRRRNAGDGAPEAGPARSTTQRAASLVQRERQRLSSLHQFERARGRPVARNCGDLVAAHEAAG